MSSTTLGVAKTVNTPLIDLSTTNIFQGKWKWPLDYRPNVAIYAPSPLFWPGQLKSICSRGGVYRWVSVGAGESWCEGQWTRAPDEVLVLVSSLNLSGDSGKSLHPWLLPHPGGANTSELNSLSQGYRYCLRKHGKCKACQVNIQVQSQHPWVNLWGNSFHIKSMLYFSWVKINSRRGWYQWPQKTNSNLTLSYRKIPQDGKTPRHAHFFHVQFDLAPMNTQRTQKVHCTLITFLGI